MLGAAEGNGDAGMPGAAGMLGRMQGCSGGCPVPQWGPVPQGCPAEPAGCRGTQGCPRGTVARGNAARGAPGLRVEPRQRIGLGGMRKAPPSPCPRVVLGVPQRPGAGTGDTSVRGPGEQSPPAAVGAVVPRGGTVCNLPMQEPLAMGLQCRGPWRRVAHPTGDTRAGCEGQGHSLLG